MKILQQIPNAKSIVKRFSVMNYSFEINYIKDKEKNTSVFTLLLERNYKEKEDFFVLRKSYAIAHQIINQRNRISTHYRKQLLKQVNDGE